VRARARNTKLLKENPYKATLSRVKRADNTSILKALAKFKKSPEYLALSPNA
jgi:hypothetical protein